MAKAQSKTSKKTKSKPAAASSKKAAKKTVKKPVAKAAKVAAKPAAKKKLAKVTAKASKATPAKKPLKKVAAKAAKPASRSAKAPAKKAAAPRKPKAAPVASAAETTQVMEELLAQATPGDGQTAAPQHRDAAASLVTDDDELGGDLDTQDHQDDDQFDNGDDMDDASFNDRGSTDSEPAGRPTYVDDGSPFPVQLARLLHDDKCTDIVLLDLRGVNPMWDYVIIGSGTSDRQMRSVLTHVAELGRHLGHEVYRRNVDDRATWLLADFSDVIVHLFEPNTRAHYDLEMLWGDAKRVEWERPAQLPRNRAGLVAGDGL